MIWRFWKYSARLRPMPLIAFAVFIAACSAGADTPTSAPATAAPTQAATTAPTEAPTEVPTEAPTEAPTEVPTEAPTEVPTEVPTAAPTNTPPPREEVYFTWAPGGVPPSDSDDVDGIISDIKVEDGIIGGNGNEIGIIVIFDPTIITLEEIIELFKSIGHPIMVAE